MGDRAVDGMWVTWSQRGDGVWHHWSTVMGSENGFEAELAMDGGSWEVAICWVRVWPEEMKVEMRLPGNYGR